jgi:hypothetical protein
MVCKSAAVHLALLAMLLRAVLPAGWMPAAVSQADASPFVICTIDGPQQQTPAKPDHDRATRPCVFAASIHAAAPSAESARAEPATAVSQIVFASRSEIAPAAPQFRRNFARAPPAFG